ncbi:tripartite tricarboxylate transporter substrate binding protein [Vibrio ostreae]|uniref:Tripartite tricarboxylate transporter substrate binding protein n=1 Tax=Vibrio ostreae TaxID=2841925 RepID=A0A975U9P3_9VIBR|nr:tripartite tricarboxylate transporter substrate binding protein [Vibrio ostreae]QXO17037.1 tripartite tricarboxylate transporter substrate binding protein [Vibrio ostreae]
MMVQKIFKNTGKLLRIATIALSATVATSLVHAEGDWPTGPVKMIMHTKAGGSADVFIRTLAKSLEPEIGQEIIVINSPGGGGASQIGRIRPAEPDGLTLGVNTLTHFTSMLTNLKGTFSIDDFSWIASTQEDAIIFFVRENSDIHDMNTIKSKALKNKENINIDSLRPIGSMQNMGMSMLKNAADVKFKWVGFNATPDIIAALLGGHLDVGISNLGALKSFFDADRIKGLGVLGEKRLSGLPDVATLTQQGYDADNSWLPVRGIFGPANMPMETQPKSLMHFTKPCNLTAIKHTPAPLA